MKGFTQILGKYFNFQFCETLRTCKESKEDKVTHVIDVIQFTKIPCYFPFIPSAERCELITDKRKLFVLK